MPECLSDKAYCELPWRAMYVTVEGTVKPCCDFRVGVGSLRLHRIGDIWLNRFEAVRAILNTGRPGPGCQSCNTTKLGRTREEAR